MANDTDEPKKGNKNKGAGRPKGSANKATANARAAIARFVNKQTPRLDRLLSKIEKDHGPLEAFNCIHKLLEFHVPKLARVEEQALDSDGEPMDTTIIIKQYTLDKDGAHPTE